MGAHREALEHPCTLRSIAAERTMKKRKRNSFRHDEEGRMCANKEQYDELDAYARARELGIKCYEGPLCYRWHLTKG